MHALRRTPAVLGLAVILLCGRTAAQRVFVVDDVPGPGVDHTTVFAAVHAAQPGDIVLVKDGEYWGANSPSAPDTWSWTVSRGVDVVSDEGARPRIPSSLKVLGLPADQQLFVRGIDLHMPWTTWDASSAPGARVEDCAGVVWFESCAFQGVASTRDPVTWESWSLRSPGLIVRDAPRVSLVGGSGHGKPGLLVEESTVRAFDFASAGFGGFFTYDLGGLSSTSIPGEHGLVVGAGGLLLLEGGEAVAGPPGEDCVTNPFLPLLPCNTISTGRGAGLLIEGLTGQAGRVVSREAVFDGSPDVDPGAGEHVVWSGEVTRLSAPSPLREDQAATVTVRGPPQALTLVAVSPRADTWPAPIPGFSRHVTPDALVQFLGVTDLLGRLDVDVTAPELPVGMDGIGLCVQAATSSAGASFVLSNPTRVVLLDGSF